MNSPQELAAALEAAYPALRGQIAMRPEDLAFIARGKLRLARDLRTYRRLVAAFVPDLSDYDRVRRGLRLFARRERMRVGARELLASAGADIDTTARELSDLAQVCIDIAVTEALGWAEARFGPPMTLEGQREGGGERCAFTVIGMGKLGGRELNPGSDVDLLPFYETDDGAAGEQSLHEHFTRVTRRFTATLDDVTEDGFCWRVDLRLRPEGSRGPLVNALAAAERYYETWGRTWERAALVRARPIAGDLRFGIRVLDALGPFVWRRVVDPNIAHEMTNLVQRARAELSEEPERDLKLGPGGIREAEFFVQSLQLIWGGKDPSLRQPNTIAALRCLRTRGLVTDREGREVESAYLALRRLEHRVQTATGIQTHTLPRGELLEVLARSLGHASGLELERELDKTRRRVAARLASLTRDVEPYSKDEATYLEPLFSALDEGSEPNVLAALSEGLPGLDFSTSASADLARHLLALARRPDFPLGANTRDRHPRLAPALLQALADAADPEQAARLLAGFFARLATPSVYVRAMAGNVQLLRKLVGLFGASAFLGEKLVYHPELVESVLFSKGAPTPQRTRLAVAEEVEDAERVHDDAAEDPEESLVGALRRVKARITMEVGLAELSGEIRTRDATRVLSELADATLEEATSRALADRGLTSGLSVIAMGKLGGREIGYGSDLDIFFVYESADEDNAEKFIRAAQRVLSLVSMPHGAGQGYDLDTRLRPSGSQGLLVVGLDAFRRYHETEGQDWERQALVKARPCAGDPDLGARFVAVAHEIAYGRGAPDPQKLHHLRMRMERELAKEGPRRYDLKVGHGGLVDVEFATQWLQMKHGADLRVRTSDTETALGALEACGYIEPPLAAILREGYASLRRLEQALRVVHGTSASLIEEGAPGLGALARRVGLRDGPHGTAVEALFERYRVVTRDVRAAYLTVLGL